MDKSPTQELLTMLQAQHDGCSVYELHNILSVSKANIYQFAKGENEMSPDTLLIACDILDVDPQPWLIRIELKRCRSPKRREILKKLLKKMDAPEIRAMAGVVACFMVGLYTAFPI